MKTRDRLTMDHIPMVDNPRHPMHKDNLLQTILGVSQFDWLREGLGQINPLKGNYNFGKKGNVNVRHNLLDELVNRVVERAYFNRYEDMQPELSIGTQFGKNNRGYTDLKISPKNIGFNAGIKF